MKKYIGILKNTKLFAGAGEEEIQAMLSCLGAVLHHYKKGDYVFRAGEYVHNLTVLVEGGLHIQKDDYWGNRAILGDVVAVKDSSVIFFDIYRILSVCPSACKFHSLVIKNLFFEISEKNRKLVAKLGHISNRTTREKLLSYLSDEAKRNKSSAFSIPFNRQQLADFLSVDRSAMSNELCKMRDEGLIEFNKNRFVLL